MDLVGSSCTSLLCAFSRAGGSGSDVFKVNLDGLSVVRCI